MYDRIAIGGVRDFLAFNFFDFPVFNIADVAITVAAIMMVIYILFLDNDKVKNKGTKKVGEHDGTKDNSK